MFWQGDRRGEKSAYQILLSSAKVFSEVFTSQREGAGIEQRTYCSHSEATCSTAAIAQSAAFLLEY